MEIDLKYPDKLHELHNDYPLTAEKCEICYDMLSNYCKKIADKYGIKVRNVKILVLNLDKKLIMSFITKIISFIYQLE